MSSICWLVMFFAIFMTLSESENSCVDILRKQFFHVFTICEQLSMPSPAVVEFGDWITFPVRYFSANAVCLFWKCPTLHCLLFAKFLLQIKHTGKPAVMVVKANKSVHTLLNFLFSSNTFLLLDFQSIASLGKHPLKPLLLSLAKLSIKVTSVWCTY